MNSLLFFALLLKASLFSTSGLGNLPILHDDLLARGWATERHFAQSLAVGQVSPGPNGLWVISLGYFVDGLRGALFALVAISLPPLLVLLVDRLYRRVQDHPAMEGFVRGLSLAVIGTFAVILCQILVGSGLNLRSLLIALASLLLGATGRVPIVLILLLAGLAGFLLAT